MKFFKFLILNFNAQFSRSHFPNKLEHADKICVLKKLII